VSVHVDDQDSSSSFIDWLALHGTLKRSSLRLDVRLPDDTDAQRCYIRLRNGAAGEGCAAAARTWCAGRSRTI